MDESPRSSKVIHARVEPRSCACTMYRICKHATTVRRVTRECVFATDVYPRTCLAIQETSHISLSLVKSTKTLTDRRWIVDGTPTTSNVVPYDLMDRRILLGGRILAFAPSISRRYSSRNVEKNGRPDDELASCVVTSSIVFREGTKKSGSSEKNERSSGRTRASPFVEFDPRDFFPPSALILLSGIRLGKISTKQLVVGALRLIHSMTCSLFFFSSLGNASIIISLPLYPPARRTDRCPKSRVVFAAISRRTRDRSELKFRRSRSRLPDRSYRRFGRAYVRVDERKERGATWAGILRGALRERVTIGEEGALVQSSVAGVHIRSRVHARVSVDAAPERPHRISSFDEASSACVTFHRDLIRPPRRLVAGVVVDEDTERKEKFPELRGGTRASLPEEETSLLERRPNVLLRSRARDQRRNIPGRFVGKVETGLEDVRGKIWRRR